MFPLPVANGKNRPTTLASTQFGGSGIVILFFFLFNNVVSYNKCVFATRDPTGAVSVVLCVVCFSGGCLLLVRMLSLLLCVSLGRQSCSCWSASGWEAATRAGGGVLDPGRLFLHITEETLPWW